MVCAGGAAMRVRHYWVVNSNLLTVPHPFIPGSQEVVTAAEYDACAQAAVEMAQVVIWREERSGSIGSQDHRRAQAVIEQYGAKS